MWNDFSWLENVALYDPTTILWKLPCERPWHISPASWTILHIAYFCHGGLLYDGFDVSIVLLVTLPCPL